MKRLLAFPPHFGITFIKPGPDQKFQQMKILVTGATGLLGSNIARELHRAGEEVMALLRPSSDRRGIADMPCKVFYGDLTSYEQVARAVKECDAIIHAASTTSIIPMEFSFYENINVKGTANIVRAALELGNKRLIYVSTANTFGPGSKINPGTELSEFSLFGFNSGYINSKYIAQQFVLEAVEKHNLNAVIVNPTFIVGPYDIKPSSGKLLLYGLRNKIIWCPPGGKNFVHVRDVAQGIYHILQKGAKGECYLLAGENLSYREFFSLLSEVTGIKKPVVELPKTALYGAGIASDIWGALSKQKLEMNLTNLKLACLENYYSGNKAKTAFKLNNTPIRLAIEEALGWFEKEGSIK